MPVSTESEKTLERAYTAVMADYGEFFWVSGYRYNTYTSGDQIIGMEILPVYTMDAAQREEKQRQIEAEAADGWKEFRLKPGITRRRSLSTRH